MSQALVTAVIGLVLLVAIATSFIRSRRGGDDSEAAGTNIHETMRDAEEYFGIPSNGKSGNLVDELDLAPARMLTQMKGSGSRHSSKR